MPLDLGTLTAKVTADTAEFDERMTSATAKGAAFGAGMVDVGLLLEKAAGAVLEFGKEAVQEFAKAEQAQLRLNAAILGSGQAISSANLIEYADQLARVTTFQDEAAVAAEKTMVAYGLSERQIKSLLPVVADLASGMGTDLPDAAQLIVRSMDMGAGSLTRAGIHMSAYQKAAFEAAD